MSSAPQAVHIAVHSTTLRLALAYVVENLGHRTTVHRCSADITVTDLPTWLAERSTVDTLVVDPLPLPCQRAVDAIVSGAARTAITSDDPESLGDALSAAHRGVVTLPQCVVARANTMPRLSDRLAQTLRLVVAGHTNTTIAHTLHQSESTVKRDIAALLQHFSAANRQGLPHAANSAGFGR